MAPSYTQRRKIAEDTLDRISVILHEVREGSIDSTFVKEQLPPLQPLAAPFPSVPIRVVNCDSFALARSIMNRTDAARGKTAVLNLASDLEPAGGWTETLSVTQVLRMAIFYSFLIWNVPQEEALCYSSTLYHTLKDQWYPWPNLGTGAVAGIYSPSVVIFKDDLDHDCVDLPPEERRVVSVITVAAPRSPVLGANRQTLKWPADLECFREKIRLVYRMAAHNGQEYLVLGGMHNYHGSAVR